MSPLKGNSNWLGSVKMWSAFLWTCHELCLPYLPMKQFTETQTMQKPFPKHCPKRESMSFWPGPVSESTSTHIDCPLPVLQPVELLKCRATLCGQLLSSHLSLRSFPLFPLSVPTMTPGPDTWSLENSRLWASLPLGPLGKEWGTNHVSIADTCVGCVGWSGTYSLAGSSGTRQAQPAF